MDLFWRVLLQIFFESEGFLILSGCFESPQSFVKERGNFALLGRPCFSLLVFEHADRFDLCVLLICELREAIGLLSCISDRNNGVGKTFEIFIEFPNFLQGVVDLCHLLDVGVFRFVEPFCDRVFRDVVNDLVQRLPGGVVGRNDLLDVQRTGVVKIMSIRLWGGLEAPKFKNMGRPPGPQARRTTEY